MSRKCHGCFSNTADPHYHSDSEETNMSAADTAEYEREQWAKVLTARFKYGQTLSGQQNSPTGQYREGYLAALDDVAHAMNLTVKVEKEYTP